MKGEKVMRKKVLFLAVLLVAGMTSATSLQADILVSEYEKVKNTPDFKTYIGGVAMGYGWANIDLRMSKQPPLYCMPSYRRLTVEKYLNLLEKELEKNKEIYNLDTPVEFILLKGLQKTFPCDN
jgi:hypothetical protein